MKRRIGILTSGGDCPGLNACIRGVARASYSMFDTEIVGIQDGYAGLIAGDYKEMKQSDFSGILTLGGTILGTRRTPFRNMRVVSEDGVDKVKAMKANYKKMKLDCLVTYGPASQETAKEAQRLGVPEVLHCETREEAAQALSQRLRPGDGLLAKGSRGMRLEEILKMVYNRL